MDSEPEKIFQAIKREKAAMRPKWYFILQAALFATGSVILLLLLLYLASFLVFAAEQSGAWFAPGFGLAGWWALFGSFPWLLTILVIIFMVLLGVLVRHYAFVYEQPLAYLFLGIAALVGIGGFLLAGTSLHENIFDSSRDGRLPILENFYSFEMGGSNEIRRGTVVATGTYGFIIQDADGTTSTVVVLPTYAFSPAIGQDIVVFGERSPSGTIDAAGIRQLGQ